MYIHEIITQFSPEVEKEFDVSFSGSGGQMPYDVAIVGVKFTAYRRGSLQEAREFEVKTIEKLTAMINSHEKIIPFLRESPFPTNRVSISITYINPETYLCYTDGSIAHAFSAKGNIYYSAEDSNGKIFDLEEETYDKAVSLLNK
jgi:hypothetical protein